MNTYKQINIMIGLLFVGLVGTFLYWIWDNGYNLPGIDVDGREAVAQVRQEKEQVDRGAFIYARNCRSCHGFTGAGALERTGLPGAALNQDTNRPPTLKTSEIAPRQLRLTGTIHCGRVGTIMPPWSTEEGGPLNEFQILQLVTLITSQFAEEGWADAVEYANEADVFSPARELEEAVGADDDTLRIGPVTGLPVDTDAANGTADALIRIGGDTIDEPYELINIIEVNEDDDTITVERGAAGSEAIEHAAGVEVYQGPSLPPDGPITGEVPATPPCGQAPYTAPTGGGDAVTLADGDEIDMQDNVFVAADSQNPAITVPAGAALTLKNSGIAGHDLRIDGPDGAYSTDDDGISDPDFIAGGAEGTITIDLDPGTYNYQCDFHPTQMLGEITVQ